MEKKVHRFCFCSLFFFYRGLVAIGAEYIVNYFELKHR